MKLRTRDSGNSGIATRLVVVAFGITAIYITLVVILYLIPWSRPFDWQATGPASEWLISVLTALGIIGLVYELHQLRLGRADETAREINSLMAHTEYESWPRDVSSPQEPKPALEGTAITVRVRNDGDRKAMRVKVELLMPSGRNIPLDWIVEQRSLTVPPRGIESSAEVNGERQPALIAHIPTTASAPARELSIRVTWIDAWNRQVEMVNNGPARVLGA